MFELADKKIRLRGVSGSKSYLREINWKKMEINGKKVYHQNQRDSGNILVPFFRR